jgi:hypothetical protein
MATDTPGSGVTRRRCALVFRGVFALVDTGGVSRADKRLNAV